MKLRLHKRLIEILDGRGANGTKVLKLLGLDEERRTRNFEYVKWVEVDISRYDLDRVKQVREALVPFAGGSDAVLGAGVALVDVDKWLAALKDPSKLRSMTVRKARQFADLLIQNLLLVPGPRVYEQTQDVAWNAYYVEEVRYHPPEKDSHGRVYPEYVTMDLAYRRFGSVHTFAVRFNAEECENVTAVEALGKKGYVFETQALRKEYEWYHERFTKLYQQVGLQMLATGPGTCDLDDLMVKASAEYDHHDRRRSGEVWLDRDGGPGRVVIDVLSEEKEELDSLTTSNRGNSVNLHFWSYHKLPKTIQQELDEEAFAEFGDDEIELEELSAVRTLDAIPVHPELAVFSLDVHRRCSVHVAQLEDYTYDPSLRDKLVLPEDTRELVEMLVDSSGVFQDIVRSKGGGAVVLCAGPPGVGKTLTAEVYSEVSARPLYSIQCSQLGTKPDKLEATLLVAFRRAQRWKAILLLDEADVYVAARGTDLIQNAIVGVFLRVLEAYRGVLFLTTNRAESVDDAIASRCIARLDYTIPTTAQQRRIWEVLTVAMGVKAEAKALDGIVKAYPRLSGRDVKNLVKLAKLVLAARGGKLTTEVVAFVKKFKPTVDASA